MKIIDVVEATSENECVHIVAADNVVMTMSLMSRTDVMTPVQRLLAVIVTGA